MKRTIAVTDSGLEAAKRVKIDSTPFFDHEIPQQRVTELIENGIDENKWINGKVKMVFPITNGKLEVIAAVYSPNPPHHVIPIIFQLSPPLIRQLDLSPLNDFQLLLRGSKLEVGQPRHTCTLPFQLVYSNDVHILWKCQNPESGVQTLNTWLAVKKPTRGDNTWYSSGGEEEPPEDEASIESPPKSPTSNEPVVGIHSNPDIPELSNPKQNKKQQRKEVKRRKKEASAGPVAANNLQSHSTILNASVSSDITVVHKSSDNPSVNRSFLQSETPMIDSLSGDQSASFKSFSASNGPESTSPAFSRYSRISEVQVGQRVHVCGVVVDVSDMVKKTKTGDWMCYITIVDQYCIRSYASGKWNGLKINCFTKRHQEWLPYLKRGDVAILRDVKIDTFMGNNVGVGHHGQLRWAAYSPSTGEIYYGSPNNAPAEEELAEGFGGLFSPFYETDETDIQYCIWLSDWWKKLMEKDIADTVMPLPIAKGNWKRLHRLICETGPHVHPNGFFDCTIEVLRLFTTPQGIHSLFVTDYTLSPGSGSSSKAWSASLNDYVVQFEMWDEAARIAEATMKPGEYYVIKNARMRLNNSGFLEGKVSEAKITQLDEDDAENDIHLKALLKRKEEWISKFDTAVDSFQLVQTAEVGQFFDCIVEVLHVDLRPHQMPRLYVADYSGKSRLAVTCGNEVWSRDLEGQIIKIMLVDEQKSVTESATVGTILSVRKLRLKFNTVENGICGILGGSEKLITPLNVKRIDNDRLNDLLRRKEEWAKSRQKHQWTRTSLHSAPLSNLKETTYTRIRDMPLQETDINRYRIVAKVVDFYPLELKDAFYQKCSSCKRRIPKNHHACFDCVDSDHDFIQYCYQMFILIEDDVGDQIKVSINDKCSLFDGLKRSHLVDDSPTLHAFCARVGPLLGALTNMDADLKLGKVVEIENPLLSFEIDTWIFSEGEQKKRAFSLSAFEQI